MSELFLGGLGRFEPPDFDHVEKFPYATVAPSAPITAEILLTLPSWHKQHDQGQEGACVGFGSSMMLAILNTAQCLAQGDKTPYVRYNPWWLWNQAKLVDPFPDTNPGDDNGTTVSAAMDVLRNKGHVGWPKESDPKSFGPVNSNYGINTNRWAKTVDEVRTAISQFIPVSIGVNWYNNFDQPTYKAGEQWIGDAADLGSIRGGHCVCIYGASDHRQAVRIKNSWGAQYPEVWMPYKVLDRLISEGGEVTLVTDK